ncbi:MAG: TatD family hydrolase [Candidatus Dormibacteraceae bacterium]
MSTVVEDAVRAGVTRMIAMGVDQSRSEQAVVLANRHAEVFAGIGHYPLERAEMDLEAMRALAKDQMVVVIGEVGLDFESVGGLARETQIERLDMLFSLAVELNLPVSIHNRGADAEMAEVIARHPGLAGVMHYFALGWDWAKRFLDLGFYLSFAGLITRPSRDELRGVVKRCPGDRLLLETDSPYGNSQKRMAMPNRPAYLVDTAELVAELRGVTLEQLGEQETANAFELFRRMS